MTNSQPTRRKTLLKYSVLLTLLGMVVIGLLIFIAVPSAVIEAAGSVNRFSPIIFFIRYCLFALIWFKWFSLVRYFQPEIDDESLIKSRQTVGIAMLAYESLYWFGPIVALLSGGN